MPFFSKRSLALPLLLVLFLAPAVAYGEDGKGSNAATTLGWISIGSGLVANLSLVIFKAARRTPILRLVGAPGIYRSIAPAYRPVLDFHIMLNSVGYFAGMAHGLMLIRGLDAVSLSLAIVMTVSMASGILLRFTSGRDTKLFGRLVHGQFVLAVLLITLVVLHVLMHGFETG